MKNRIILFFLLLSIVCYKGKSQTQNEIIDNIIKIRSSYIADSIPEVFRKLYIPLTYSGNKQYYDTLKSFLPKIPFNGNTFYWLESLADDWSTNTVALWTDNFVVHFRNWIPMWEREDVWDDSIIYKLEIYDDPKFLKEPFLNDYKEWNEDVTNRSYYFWNGAGGSFKFCSKMTFNKSDITEIKHCVFRYYNKDTPLLYLKELPEDNFTPRIRINCQWFEKYADEYEINWEYFEGYNYVIKVFDCEGNEFEFLPKE